jgi:hypothetical protein
MVHATLGIPAPPREGRGGRRWLAGGVGTGRRRKGGRDQACGAGGSTRRPELISGGHRDAAIAELRVRRVFRFVWSRHEGAGRAAFACGGRRDRLAARGRDQAAAPADRRDARSSSAAIIAVLQSLNFGSGRSSGSHSGSFGCTALRLVCLGRSGSFDCRPLRWSALVARVRLVARPSGGLPWSLGFVWLHGRQAGLPWSLGFVVAGPSGGLPWSLGFIWLQATQMVWPGRSGSFDCRPLRWSASVARVRLATALTRMCLVAAGSFWLVTIAQRSLPVAVQGADTRDPRFAGHPAGPSGC